AHLRPPRCFGAAAGEHRGGAARRHRGRRRRRRDRCPRHGRRRPRPPPRPRAGPDDDRHRPGRPHDLDRPHRCSHPRRRVGADPGRGACRHGRPAPTRCRAQAARDRAGGLGGAPLPGWRRLVRLVVRLGLSARSAPPRPGSASLAPGPHRRRRTPCRRRRARLAGRRACCRRARSRRRRPPASSGARHRRLDGERSEGSDPGSRSRRGDPDDGPSGGYAAIPFRQV
ncbi:MAG: Glycerophosphoryl diester phosphodiesterase, partial [uncultured Thermomicrobiales bacterium]